MKKRPAIGLSVIVLVLSVVIGIASLPDDVLIDSSEIKNTQTTPTSISQTPALEESQQFIANAVAEKNIDAAKAEIDALKQEMKKLQSELVELKTDSQEQDKLPEKTVEKQTPPQKDTSDKSGGKVIKVKIDDGVGASMR